MYRDPLACPIAHGLTNGRTGFTPGYLSRESEALASEPLRHG